MRRVVPYLRDNRKLLTRIFIVYCCICCAIIIGNSVFSSPETENKTKLPPISINKFWAVAVDGKMEAKDVTMPYALKAEEARVIDLYTTIPENKFSTAAISFLSFQKNIWIYLEGEEIYKYVFESNDKKNITGSGRVVCSIPYNSTGKLLHIRLEKINSYDFGPVGDIMLMDGGIDERNFIPANGFVFTIAIGLFVAGLLLLTTAGAYISFGAKLLPLIYLSLLIMSTSLWVICSSRIAQMFTSNWALIHDLEYLSFYILPITLWGFLNSNWKFEGSKSRIMLYVMSVFFGVAITLKVFGIADFYGVLRISHTLILLNIPFIADMAINNSKEKELSLKIFYLGVIILVSLALSEMFRFYKREALNSLSDPFILGLSIMIGAMIISFVLSTKETMSKLFEDRFYKELAYRDSLTALGNRTKFEKDIQDLEERKHKFESLIFVVADANYLKNINDTMGHITGDLAIRTMAEAMKKSFDERDQIYRIGGDEFFMIIKDKSINEVEAYLEKLDEILLCTDLGFPLSLSYGFAQYEQSEHDSLMKLYKLADDKMYETKHYYRNIVEE